MNLFKKDKEDKLDLSDVRKQMENLLIMTAEKTIDDETLEKSREMLTEKLQEKGLSYELNTLKALIVGIELGMSSHEQDVAIPLLMCAHKLARVEENLNSVTK